MKVIGIAGTQEKCDWLVNDLGFDAALNYRKDDLVQGLKAFAPDGIDLHFENVGGLPFDAGLKNMKAFGRMVFCGFISVYNNENSAPYPDMSAIVRRRLTVTGFAMPDHFDLFPSIFKELGKLMMDGKLKYRLDIEDGLETAPMAVDKLFEGTNTGKLVVRVSEP